MNSLSDLRDFYSNQQIPIKKFNGYNLIIGKDVWTMAHGQYYCNSVHTNPKDNNLIEVYKKLEHEIPASKRLFKAMGSSNFLKEE